MKHASMQWANDDFWRLKLENKFESKCKLKAELQFYEDNFKWSIKLVSKFNICILFEQKLLNLIKLITPKLLALS